MMKKLKNPINVLLLFIIAILAQFIILPPFLRIVIADVNLSNKKDPTTKVNKDIEVLVCTKFDLSTSTLITSRTSYKYTEPNQLTITYEKIESNANLTSEETSSSSTTNEELDFFSSIDGVEITKQKNKAIILIPDYVVELNEANETLLEYFNNIEAQQKFYEEKSYKCEKAKN